jgi:hypothetical protein
MKLLHLDLSPEIDGLYSEIRKRWPSRPLVVTNDAPPEEESNYRGAHSREKDGSSIIYLREDATLLDLAAHLLADYFWKMGIQAVQVPPRFADHTYMVVAEQAEAAIRVPRIHEELFRLGLSAQDRQASVRARLLQWAGDEPPLHTSGGIRNAGQLSAYLASWKRDEEVEEFFQRNYPATYDAARDIANVTQSLPRSRLDWRRSTVAVIRVFDRHISATRPDIVLPSKAIWVPAVFRAAALDRPAFRSIQVRGEGKQSVLIQVTDDDSIIGELPMPGLQATVVKRLQDKLQLPLKTYLAEFPVPYEVDQDV